ncbi:MAG TPA: hypothetical protein VN794_11045 [Methylomirabilota bacterium]|jgi:hypothetical protein|nr:hypothetical protein [Methylomirabilota bacterium]
MFFSRPAPEFPKITSPTAAEICAKSKPSPQGQALLAPGMTPGQYQGALEKNKMSVDSVNFLAHGMQPKDSVCWACQASRMTAPKLSGPELNALQSTECWLKNPTAGMRASMAASLANVDYTGPGSWAAQAGMWAPIPGVPALPGAPGLTASAVVGAIMLAAGLRIGPAMPPIPNPRLCLPMGPPTPQMLLALQQPQVPQIPLMPPIPIIDQPKLMKMLFPFIDLGKGVASGTVTCC